MTVFWATSMYQPPLWAVNGTQGEDASYVGRYDTVADTWDFSPPRRPTNHLDISPLTWGVAVGRSVCMSLLYNDVYEDAAWIAGTTASSAGFAGTGLNQGQTSDGLVVYAMGRSANTPKFAKYDPVADSWTFLTAPATARVHTAMCIQAGKVYVFAGSKGPAPFTATFQTDIYDIAGDSWSSGASMPSTGGTSRWDALAVPAGNGKIYVVGGSGSGSNSTKNDRCTEYDPDADSWTDRAYMPSGVGADYPGGTLDPATGLVHVLSAEDSPANNNRRRYAVHLTYNPATDQWAEIEVLPDLPNGDEWHPPGVMTWVVVVAARAGWGIVQKA